MPTNPPPPAAPDREGEELHRQPYAMPIAPHRMRDIENVRDRVCHRYAACEERDWPTHSERGHDPEWMVVDLLTTVAALTAERDEARGALRLAAKAIVGYSDAAATPVPGASHE